MLNLAQQFTHNKLFISILTSLPTKLHTFTFSYLLLYLAIATFHILESKMNTRKIVLQNMTKTNDCHKLAYHYED